MTTEQYESMKASALELSRITGYPVFYETMVKTHKTPYDGLSISQHSPNEVEVVIKVPLSDFSDFHKSVLATVTARTM